MSQLNIDLDVEAIYKKYLEYCIDSDITPVAEHFFGLLTETVRRMFAIKEAQHRMAQPGNMDVLYICYRVTDMPNPAGKFEVMQCAQCNYDVLVDPSMKHILAQSNSIICNHCLPEITGMEMKEVIGGGNGTM